MIADCKKCRSFVNYCRLYKKYTEDCESFIDDTKIVKEDWRSL